MDPTLERVSKRLGSRLRRGAPQSTPPVIPTGWWVLDRGLLQIGGLPSGRVVEFAGEEGSGKSLTLYKLMAQAQKMGRGAALYDLEKVCADEPGRDWVAAQGLDLDSLSYSDEVIAEEVLYEVNELARSGDYGVIGIDSIAAMTPRYWLENMAASKKEEKEEEEEDPSSRKKKPKDFGHEDRVTGDKAKLWSMTLSRILDSATQGECLVVLINQLRDRISNKVFWNSNDSAMLESKSTGGWALRHYSSVRLLFEKVKLLSEEKRIVGLKSRVLVVKSKVSPPFRRTGLDTADHLHIYSDGRPQEGNREGELFEAAVDRGLIQRSGSWYEYGDLEQIQGKEKTMAVLSEKGLFDQLEASLQGITQEEAEWS